MYADPPKADAIFAGFRLGSLHHIKANPKYFAIATQGGGGPVAVVDHSKPGRMPSDLPVIAGHKGNLTDFDFNPFNDQVIATGGEDACVKIWTIPEEGLTQNLTDPTQTLEGHSRKVVVLRFHPTASNVLASAGVQTVKLWDIERGQEVRSLDEKIHTQAICDLAWDYTGTQYATSCKDKNLRLIDARANDVAIECKQAHDGSKTVNLSFLGRQERLLSVGFSRSTREAKLWDLRKMDVALKMISLGQGPGVYMPYFDEDNNVLYLSAKGENTTSYYEMVNDDFCELSKYSSAEPTKCLGFMPKRACNVLEYESARAFKVIQSSQGDAVVQKLSFIVPRKTSGSFEAELFPPTFAGVPSHTADQWLDGSNSAPMVKSLNPKDDGSAQAQDLDMKEYVAPKTTSELKVELEEAQARIAILEAKLMEAKIALP